MKPKIFFSIIVFMVLGSNAMAQINTVWTMRDTSDLGRGNKMVMDNTGNIYVCGRVGYLFTISKLDPNGNIIWKEQSSTEGEAMDIVFDGSSNIYVTGINIENNTNNIIIQKYNSAGGLIWNVSSAQSNDLNEYSNILKDNSGNIIINYSVADSINTSTQFYTKKYNPSGTLISNYEKTVPGLGWSRIRSDNNGNIFILYNESFIIEKLNPSGGLLWSKEFNPAGNNFASDFYVDGNSNVFVIGTQNNGATANDFVTLKYNSSGVLQWSSFYNNDSVITNNSDIGQTITIDYSGNVIATGDSQTGEHYNRKVNKTIKYDANGLEQWRVGNLHPHYRNSTRVVKTDNMGNIYVLNWLVGVPPGPPRSRARLFKYNNSGILMWDVQGYSTYQDHPKDMIIDNNMNVYMSSGAGNPLEGFCLTVIKFGQTSVGITNNTIPTKFSLSQNYPNPFNPSTNIQFDIQRQGLVSLKVYDFLGREIKTLINESLQAGSYESSFDASGLGSGVYFYKLEAEGFSETKKMILLK